MTNTTSEYEFTDRLRIITRVAIGDQALRKAGEEMGVGHTVLARFLQGRPASSQTIDRIVYWLDARGWRL